MQESSFQSQKLAARNGRVGVGWMFAAFIVVLSASGVAEASSLMGVEQSAGGPGLPGSGEIGAPMNSLFNWLKGLGGWILAGTGVAAGAMWPIMGPKWAIGTFAGGMGLYGLQHLTAGQRKFLDSDF